MAAKKTEINYTPEELSEIDRIVNVINSPPEIIHEEKPVAAPVVNNIQKISDHELNGFDIEDTDMNLESDIEDMDMQLESNIEDTDMQLESNIEDTDMQFESDIDLADETKSEFDEIDQIDDIPAEEDITYLNDSDLAFVDEPSDAESSEMALDEEFGEETQADIKDESFAIEKGDDDIPDFDDIAMKDGSDIQEADIDDISAIDISDIDDISMKDGSDIPDAGEDDISAIDIYTDPADEPTSEFDEIDEIPDSFNDLDEPGPASDKTE